MCFSARTRRRQSISMGFATLSTITICRAGLGKRQCTSLRHTYPTLYLQKGDRVERVQKVLGHIAPVLECVYAVQKLTARSQVLNDLGLHVGQCCVTVFDRNLNSMMKKVCLRTWEKAQWVKLGKEVRRASEGDLRLRILSLRNGPRFYSELSGKMKRELGSTSSFPAARSSSKSFVIHVGRGLTCCCGRINRKSVEESRNFAESRSA